MTDKEKEMMDRIESLVKLDPFAEIRDEYFSEMAVPLNKPILWKMENGIIRITKYIEVTKGSDPLDPKVGIGNKRYQLVKNSFIKNIHPISGHGDKKGNKIKHVDRLVSQYGMDPPKHGQDTEEMPRFI